MNSERSRSQQPDRERQAAAWVARQDRGLTAEEQDQLFEWLASDPRHGESLARHRATARKLKALAQWRPEHAMRPNPDLLEPPRRRRKATLLWLPWAALAAAACVALATWLWVRLDVPEAPPLAMAIPPATEQQTLEDGSTIDLNRGAEVRVLYTATERRVELVKGEALFAVAKNPARPFVVQAGKLQIRALGTAFNVNLQPAAVEVLVTEGTVSVDKSATIAPEDVAEIPALSASSPPSTSAALPVALLEKGHRVLVPFVEVTASPRPEVVPVSKEEIARLLAWRPRRLEFTNSPLGYVIAEFNRENRIKLVIEDPTLGALPIGASFRSDNVEGFVRLLEASFQVQAEQRGEVIMLRKKSSAKTAH